MLQKTVPKRRSWASIKRAKADSEKRRVAYCEAKEAFELAERVRQARELVGLTQAELASRIGSTQPAVARLEAGGSPPERCNVPAHRHCPWPGACGRAARSPCRSVTVAGRNGADPTTETFELCTCGRTQRPQRKLSGHDEPYNSKFNG